MPLQGDEVGAEAAEDWIGRTLLGELDREHPHLGTFAGSYRGAKARGEELRTETNAEERNAMGDSLRYPTLLVAQPAVLGLVVHAHRAAHDDHDPGARPRRQSVAGVQLDDVKVDPATGEHVGVETWPLTGDVLEDEGSLHDRRFPDAGQSVTGRRRPEGRPGAPPFPLCCPLRGWQA